jgi:predicted negative regulator of RcsB-dependent stress response
MKDVLQQVKVELEKAYDHPESSNIDRCIAQLQQALEQNGDKGTMIENCIRAVTQARNSIGALQNAGDISSAGAFGEAYNALDQAIESYTD